MGHDIMALPRCVRGSRAYATEEEARTAGTFGANLRCNRCGGWGALWYLNQRPGWGCMALCGPHAIELHDEMVRHHDALLKLRCVEFEQPHRPSPVSVGIND